MLTTRATISLFSKSPIANHVKNSQNSPGNKSTHSTKHNSSERSKQNSNSDPEKGLLKPNYSAGHGRQSSNVSIRRSEDSISPTMTADVHGVASTHITATSFGNFQGDATRVEEESQDESSATEDTEKKKPKEMIQSSSMFIFSATNP